MDRRHFLGSSAALLMAAGLHPTAAPASTALLTLSYPQQPPPLGAVRLTGGLLKERFDLNARRTFALAPEDILTPFFRAAGLKAPGKNLHSGAREANFTGYWPGLYEGFWISGAAHIARWSGDPAHRATLSRIVHELAKTRAADGYMLAMGREPATRWAHDDLYAMVRVTVRCLLDVFELTGDALALELARGQMDALVRDITGNRHADGGLVLRGMDPKKAPSSDYKLLPALAQLFRHTGDEKYLAVARRCLDPQLIAALVSGASDPLPGRHASTWVDHLLGLHQLGLMTGNERWRQAALKAAARIREHHLYVTGSFSSYEQFSPMAEGWQRPDACRTQETCCGAIWLTLLESLLHGTGDFAHADCIERVVYNDLFASQSQESGDFCYFLNLAGDGKPHDPPPAFGRHCCEGTGLMSIGRLPGLIYGATAEGLAINLYAASEARLKINDTPVRVEQRTGYPFEGGVTINVHPERPVRFSLSWRQPSWCDAPVAIEVNGRRADAQNAIEREWKPGDTVCLRFEMKPRLLRDDFNNTPRVALQRGPLVYAATWTDDLPVRQYTGPGILVLSSQSHHERYPYLPAVVIGDDPDASFAERPGYVYEAEGVAALAPEDSGARAGKLRLRYIPFLAAIPGKYGVWLPVHRKLV